MAKYRIKDICDSNLLNIRNLSGDVSINYLDTSSITHGVISEYQVLRLKEAPSRAQRMVSNGTIIYSLVRPNLCHYGYIDRPVDNLVVSTGFLTLNLKKSFRGTIDIKFLYLLLTQPSLTQYLHIIAQNAVSAYPSLTPSDLEGLTFDFPEYDVQKRISSLFFDIDSKIALNREINRNLVAMARQLYDYWFVQFDFPDVNGKPYKSSGGKMVWNNKLRREIPEGWIIGSLPDIAVFTNGIACQKFRPENNIDKIPVIKIREMRDGITDECEWVKSDIPDSVRVQNGDILFSWSASLEVMIWCNGEGGLNQHIFKVTSKNDYPQSYIFFQILDYIGVFKSIAEARKTTMGHITQDHLNQSAIVLPDSSCVLAQFEKKVVPIFQQYVANNVEISLLKKKRDELLPLLMNGQVSVMPPEVNCDLYE